MSEQITIFDVEDPEREYSADRTEFKSSIINVFKNKQNQQQGYVSTYVLIFNQQGELLIQQRSLDLSVNAGKWCLSVAGHQTFGFTPSEIAALESVEEMGIPVVELGADVFAQGYNKMKPYLNTLGLIKFLGTYLDIFPKMYQGVGMIPCVSKKHLFIGVYHGTPRPLDGEVITIKSMSLPELYQAMEKDPDQFTADLRMVVEKYKDDLEGVVTFLKTS